MTEISKNSVIHTLITENEGGQRLDNLLFKKCKGVPKSHVYTVVRSGQVRVNGRRADAAYRLQIGDVLRIPPMRVASANGEQAAIAGAELKVHLPVLYEDEALLIVDKPAGIAVHGGSGESFGVIEALRRQRPQARFLELAHRLDRETSGILLLGKKRSALLALHQMFREGGQAGAVGAADKRYQVLVCGRWSEPLRHVRLPLLKYLLSSGERRVRVADDGRAAHTVFRLLARWERFSLLEAELRTGRTHQIRVHLAHLGFPVAGDEKYGDYTANHALAREGLKRMFLHAWQMRFPHPVDGRRMVVQAPLPEALTRFVERLATPESLANGR
ncbi:RluA family pseudouridine synthase [Accumulibacter sp.]|uniref:RluA family pseudouridine synthase n=1 Tax=Accumulibacter sp. TaxID=2053492 RepID=UPI0026341656|nr:RluA family pseudouridine synthase [Accumulibacter sp.]